MQGRRIKDFFSRDRKTLYMILSIVLISVFLLTIVYAALSVTLNIVGNAEVVSSSWDIHLDNVKVTSGSVSGDAPTITGGITATFSTILITPGDFYEFTIDVVNSGSIDAMIDGVSKTPTLTTAQAKYLNYIIEYQNGESISTKQLVKKNDYVRLKVRVEYRKDITASDLPTTTETLNLSFKVNYVQSDGTGSSVDNSGGDKVLITADGSLDDIGTVVTIGTEQFYIIGTEGDNVKLLSMYNLYVGGDCGYDFLELPECYSYTNSTGMQDFTMLGYVSSQSVNKGITVFSNTSSTYEGSIVEGYVNNYKNILESNFGVEIVEARLISYEELTDHETFACVKWMSCSDKYPWIYLTSYWTMSADNYGNVFGVYSYNSFDSDFHYNSEENFGVRPVIVISRDLIDGNSSSAT